MAKNQTLNLTMEGGERLRADFKERQRYLASVAPRLSKKIADQVAIVAVDLVAKDERKVMANIRARSMGIFAQVVATRGGERDIVPALLEMGTYKMAPRPFMVPALRMARAAGAVAMAVREVGGLLKP